MISADHKFYSLDLQNLLAKLKKQVDEQGFKNIYEQLEALREDVVQKKTELQSLARDYCRLGSSRRYTISEFTNQF